jgi:hypothetical protein
MNMGQPKLEEKEQKTEGLLHRMAEETSENRMKEKQESAALAEERRQRGETKAVCICKTPIHI